MTTVDKPAESSAVHGHGHGPVPGPVSGPVPAKLPRQQRGAAADVPVVRLVDGTAELGERPVLRGVDLTVQPGEVVALLGANGSGKSTLVRTVVGLVPLSGGRLELFGAQARKFKDWGRIGYVPQRTTAAAGVPASVREVVTSGLLTGRGFFGPGRGHRAAVDGALDSVGMLDRAGDGIAHLSGGQQQRVLIARALARRPDLLIMDEPMAGVDLASQAVLAETLRQQAAEGRTVLLVLHELGPLEPLIDRTVVLRDGSVTYDGPPQTGADWHALPGHDHAQAHCAPADDSPTGLLS